MAKRNSMSSASRSRNHYRQSSDCSATTEARRGTVPASQLQGAESFDEIIRVERTRLMKAEAVFGCVAFAALYEDWLEQSPNKPCLEDALAAVGDLVRQSVDRFAAILSRSRP